MQKIHMMLNTMIWMLTDMDDIYKTIEEYNLIKKRKILIVFECMIADMLSNKKRNEIVT